MLLNSQLQQLLSPFGAAHHAAQLASRLNGLFAAVAWCCFALLNRRRRKGAQAASARRRCACDHPGRATPTATGAAAHAPRAQRRSRQAQVSPVVHSGSLVPCSGRRVLHPRQNQSRRSSAASSTPQSASSVAEESESPCLEWTLSARRAHSWCAPGRRAHCRGRPNREPSSARTGHVQANWARTPRASTALHRSRRQRAESCSSGVLRAHSGAPRPLGPVRRSVLAAAACTHRGRA